MALGPSPLRQDGRVLRRSMKLGLGSDQPRSLASRGFGQPGGPFVAKRRTIDGETAMRTVLIYRGIFSFFKEVLLFGVGIGAREIFSSVFMHGYMGV